MCILVTVYCWDWQYAILLICTEFSFSQECTYDMKTLNLYRFPNCSTYEFWNVYCIHFYYPTLLVRLLNVCWLAELTATSSWGIVPLYTFHSTRVYQHDSKCFSWQLCNAQPSCVHASVCFDFLITNFCFLSNHYNFFVRFLRYRVIQFADFSW